MRSFLFLVPVVVCFACGGTDPGGVTDGGAMDSTTGDDGSTDTGTNGDGSANDSGLGDASNDGSTTSDGGGSLKITCGPQLTCTAQQTCCVSQGGQTMYSCVGGSCPMGQTALKCAKTSDCAMGNVCCAHIDQMNNVTSQCLQACPNTPNDAQLCSNMDMPTGCAMNVMCSSNNIGDWNLPNGFATCGGKAN